MKVAVVPNLTKEAAQACTNEVLDVLAGCGCETVLKTDLFTSHGTVEKVEHAIKSRTDDVVDFKQMGIDHIFIDESCFALLILKFRSVVIWS